MSCQTCDQALLLANKTGQMVQKNYRVPEPAGPCEYNDVILTAQLDKLKWFKDKGLHVKHGYKPSLINKYIGIVLTSININNKCAYKDILDETSNLVTFIISLQ